MTHTVKLKKFEEEETGKFHFVYSDNYSVYYVMEQNRKLYLVTTDKLNNVKEANEILLEVDKTQLEEVGNDFFAYSSLKFFKPYSSYNKHVFFGIAVYEQNCLRFKIEVQDLVLNSSGILSCNEFKETSFTMLSCLDDFEVISHIQKKSIIHLVARDKVKSNDYIYGVIDTEKDVFKRLYYLYDDTGDIVLNSINVDVEEGRTRVAGYVKVDQTVFPFHEEFILR